MKKQSIQFIVGLIAATGVCAQNAKQPEFEAATVRPSSPDAILESFVPTLDAAPGSTLRFVNRQLKELIMIAYGVGGRQIDGPQWLMNPRGGVADVPRFDIVAKVPTDARREDVPAMFQALLEDRFGVRVHREQRQIPIYALETGKGGLTIKPVAAGSNRQSGCSRSMFGANGITTATCQNMTTAQLAQQLQTLSPAYFPEGPVIDKTGLTGVYDFTLEWITQQQKLDGDDGPGMFDAIDKLGLHIDKRKGEAEVLVVDKAEQKPTEN